MSPTSRSPGAPLAGSKSRPIRSGLATGASPGIVVRLYARGCTVLSPSSRIRSATSPTEQSWPSRLSAAATRRQPEVCRDSTNTRATSRASSRRRAPVGSRPGAATRRNWPAAPAASGTSRRSGSWPSPPRSTRSARLLRRPGEEGRGFFQELVLHPQPPDLGFHLAHAGTLDRRQRLLRLGILIAPRFHPVAERPVIDTQIPSHFRDRLAGLEHHLDGLSLELRAELPASLWHEQILSVGRNCPRSLIHPSSRSRWLVTSFAVFGRHAIRSAFHCATDAR